MWGDCFHHLQVSYTGSYLIQPQFSLFQKDWSSKVIWKNFQDYYFCLLDAYFGDSADIKGLAEPSSLGMTERDSTSLDYSSFDDQDLFLTHIVSA